MSSKYFDELIQECLKEIPPTRTQSNQYMGQLYKAIHFDSVDVIADLLEGCPMALGLIRTRAQELFVAACMANSVSVAQWLLDHLDTIEVEADHHSLFTKLIGFDDRETDERLDAISLLINRSAWCNYQRSPCGTYRYVKYQANYYLVGELWDHVSVQSVYLIDDVYVCSRAVVTLEEATACLESIKVHKSARTSVN